MLTEQNINKKVADFKRALNAFFIEIGFENPVTNFGKIDWNKDYLICHTFEVKENNTLTTKALRTMQGLDLPNDLMRIIHEYADKNRSNKKIIIKSNIKSVRQRFETFLKHFFKHVIEFAEVDIDLGTLKYGGNNLRCKISVKQTGASTYLELNAIARLNLPGDIIGQHVKTSNGNILKITGVNPKATKRPIEGIRLTDSQPMCISTIGYNISTQLSKVDAYTKLAIDKEEKAEADLKQSFDF